MRCRIEVMPSVVSAGGSGSAKGLSNPSALGTLCRAFSSAVLQIRAYTEGKKLLDDFLLRTNRRCRARSASPGVLHRQEEWGVPGFVPHRRVTASSEKAS
jgi:hypothetical protein